LCVFVCVCVWCVCVRDCGCLCGVCVCGVCLWCVCVRALLIVIIRNSDTLHIK